MKLSEQFRSHFPTHWARKINIANLILMTEKEEVTLSYALTFSKNRLNFLNFSIKLQRNFILLSFIYFLGNRLRTAAQTVANF